MFGDYFLFPGAERGNVFNLCKILDPKLEKVPNTIEWFTDRLNSVINVNVGTYKKKDGTMANTIKALGAIPAKYQNGVAEARTDLVGFDPYVDNVDQFAAYSKLYKFQHGILAEAKDADVIPFAGKEPAKLDPKESNTKTTSTDSTVSKEEVDDSPF